MRKQDQLQQLIHGLSANEKRYFKLFTSLKGGDKNYIKLFDALAETDTYDAGAISKVTGQSKPALAHSKEHLKDVLFRSLRSFYDDTPNEGFYHQTLEEVELLRSKGQYAWALTKIEKGLDKALSEEAFQYALLLLRLYYTVAYHAGRRDYPAAHIAIEKKLIKQQENEMHYRHLHLRYLQLVNEKKKRFHTHPGKIMQEFMNEPLLNDVRMALSKKARLLFYRINAISHNEMSGNKKMAAGYYIKGIRFFMANRYALASQYNAYILLLAGLVSIYVFYDQFDKAEAVIGEIEDSLKGLPIGAAATRYCNEVIISLRMSVLADSSAWLKVISYSRQVESSQKNVLLNAAPMVQFDFNYFKALSYWKTGELKASLQLLQQLHDEDPDGKYSFSIAHRCMYLLIQFESGNFDTLPYLIKSHQRWCKQKNLSGELTKLFSKMLMELSKAATDTFKTNAILKHYIHLFESAPATTEKRSFNAIRLTEWMKAKMKKITANTV